MTGPVASLRIVNRLPLFGWIFAACFDALVLAFAWIVVRDGWPADLPNWAQWPLAAAFVTAAIAVSAATWTQPMTDARIGVGGVLIVRRRWPMRSDETRIRSDRIGDIQVAEDRDSDGDPYFRCRVRLHDDTAIDLAEGHDRTGIAERVAHLRRALGRDGPVATESPIHASRPVRR